MIRVYGRNNLQGSWVNDFDVVRVLRRGYEIWTRADQLQIGDAAVGCKGDKQPDSILRYRPILKIERT